ncbi:CBM35 domain-containing protein [Streptomyces roseicoloratus]|uniref:CBM35 domain-containing protein n=1 Tax=Streptomyces roseicoloratus TaxID=2508722 RepID=A0ABY9RWD7_9ACTN|nr:CBM35 domain-containing protein [Streptomyces roseicoloratus]WMX45826.1 CBM35 domain-containing protein [Streptomyces roseicoloratus]
MAAGNDGTNTPEDDDPFGYLYADGQAAGAQRPQGGGYGYPGPAAQPGVPRTSYNQVRTVGERQYGGHAQQPQVPQQQAYGQPHPQYAAPETYPGGGQHRPGPPQPAPRGGRGPNTKGLLIGAVAVVAVVVAGITAAVITNSGDKTNGAGGGTSTGAPGGHVSESPSVTPSQSSQPQAPLPKQDAATLKLGGSAALARDIKGAEGADGAYVTGFNAIGSSVTWQADVQVAGAYRLYVRYAIPAKDANATLTVNDKANSNPIGLKNFISSSDPNLEKNWQTTWAPVDLKQGTNTIKLSCEQGNQCDALFDWLEIRETPPGG